MPRRALLAWFTVSLWVGACLGALGLAYVDGSWRGLDNLPLVIAAEIQDVAQRGAIIGVFTTVSVWALGMAMREAR